MSEDKKYDKKTVQEKIRRFIHNNFVFNNEKEPPHDNLSLYEHRIVDSTGILEIVDFIEETFQIRVEDEEIIPDNLDTIAKITNYVYRKINAIS